MADDNKVTVDGRSGKAPWQKMNKVFGARTAQEHAKHLIPYIKPDSRILDVGCGLGTITIDLANLAPQGQVIGIDSNPGTTQSAQETAMARGTPNVEFQLGDVYDLSAFEADSFDIVHAHQVFLYLTDPIKAIQEIRRVLKPGGAGGMLSTRDNIDFRMFPEDRILEDAMEIFRKFTAKLGANFSGGTCNHVWIHDAGFPWENIRVEHAAWGFTTREERFLWSEGVKDSYKPLQLSGDARTPEDLQVIQEHWEQWAEKPEAKLYAIDGVVLAWK